MFKKLLQKIKDLFSKKEMILGARTASNNSFIVNLTHPELNPLDSSSYYFGGSWTVAPTTISAAYYRTLVKQSGIITEIFAGIHLSGANGSAENSTLTLLKNGSAVQVISSAAKYNTQYGNYSLTGLNIPVAKGDTLSIKWDTPAWATNPNSVYHHVIVTIEY